MDNKGFTLIEILLSIVLITVILYGLSVVPMELMQLKKMINKEYVLDLSVLKLKQTIDTEIMDGGIIPILEDDKMVKLKIGKSVYHLSKATDNSLEDTDNYSFKIKGIKEDIIYSTNLIDDTSFFHLAASPEKQLKYNNKFTSFNVESDKGENK